MCNCRRSSSCGGGGWFSNWGSSWGGNSCSSSCQSYSSCGCSGSSSSGCGGSGSSDCGGSGSTIIEPTIYCTGADVYTSETVTHIQPVVENRTHYHTVNHVYQVQTSINESYVENSTGVAPTAASICGSGTGSSNSSSSGCGCSSYCSCC